MDELDAIFAPLQEVQVTVGVTYIDRHQYAIVRVVLPDDAPKFRPWPSLLVAEKIKDSFLVYEPSRPEVPFATMTYSDRHEDFFRAARHESLFIVEFCQPETINRAIVVNGEVYPDEPMRIEKAQFEAIARGDFVYPENINMAPGGLA